MPKLSKILLLIFAATLFAAVFWKFFSVIAFPDGETEFEKGEVLKLSPTFSLTQTFVANRDNLMKIEFLMRTPGPREGDIVKMEIADENCTNVIRQGEMKQAFLSSDNLYDFQFSKIPDSKDKSYCLKITLIPQLVDSKFIRFFTRENSNPLFVLKDVDGAEIENQSLMIRLAYRNGNILQDVSELNQRISQYKPWFLKHYFLSIIVILFIVLSMGLVVILILL